MRPAPDSFSDRLLLHFRILVHSLPATMQPKGDFLASNLDCRMHPRNLLVQSGADALRGLLRPRGRGMLAYHRGVGSESRRRTRGVRRTHGIEVVPTFSARGITSGGTIAAADFDAGSPTSFSIACVRPRLRTASTSPCTARWRPRTKTIPRAICWPRHARSSAKRADRRLVRSARHPHRPHAANTPTPSSSTTPIRTSISIETGAARRPVAAAHPGRRGAAGHRARLVIPALVRGDELITAPASSARSFGEAQAIEQSPGGLSAGMFIGNPFTDVPNLVLQQRRRHRRRPGPGRARGDCDWPISSGTIGNGCRPG